MKISKLKTFLKYSCYSLNENYNTGESVSFQQHWKQPNVIRKRAGEFRGFWGLTAWKRTNLNCKRLEKEKKDKLHKTKYPVLRVYEMNKNTWKLFSCNRN